jgi:hypothetical protein
VIFRSFVIVWREWCLLDTAVGAWLLNPDHTPSSFSELLARYGMQQMGVEERDLNSSVLLKDLALLGPLMVKMYRQLQVSRLGEHLFSNLFPVAYLSNATIEFRFEIAESRIAVSVS